MTVEKAHLTELIVERIGQMQRAVVAALPGNTVLHEEFHVGTSLPATPREAVVLGRKLSVPAREYRALLLNRGLDAAALARFERALVDLEALVAVEPEPVVAPPAAPVKKPAKKTKTKKKAT